MASPKKTPLSITIAIPAYNEEGNLKLVVEDAAARLPSYFEDWEILIINDGSTDGTGELADRLAAELQSTRVIHQKNGGYSAAMLRGIREARKEFVAYMPADGQFLVDDMRHCFEVLDSSDLVLGYRGGRSDYSATRVFLSYGYLLLLLVLFNIKYMDVGWVNIWRREKVQRIRLNCAGGIFILTEILVKSRMLGDRITEAPSYYRPRMSGTAKNVRLKVVVATYCNVFKLWFQIQFGLVNSSLER